MFVPPFDVLRPLQEERLPPEYQVFEFLPFLSGKILPDFALNRKREDRDMHSMPTSVSLRSLYGFFSDVLKLNSFGATSSCLDGQLLKKTWGFRFVPCLIAIHVIRQVLSNLSSRPTN